jgi:hypothetical protein
MCLHSYKSMAGHCFLAKPCYLPTPVTYLLPIHLPTPFIIMVLQKPSTDQGKRDHWGLCTSNSHL